MSDLSSYRPGEFKRKYEKELHLMIDDLEMPNDDMTISSFSQSAWQGKSTRSFLSNLTSHRGPTNDEMSASANENQLTGGTRTISRQDLNNFNGSYSSSQEFEMGDTRNNNIAGKTFKSQEEGRGSPAFARDQISVTDDLTLSQTNEEGKSSYRGTGVGIININDQSKSHTDREYATLGDHGHSQMGGVLRNQNRTFADSVIDHHASQMAVSAGPKNYSAFKQSSQDHGADVLPGKRDPRVRSSPFDINEENELEASEISELDYLAQT